MATCTGIVIARPDRWGIREVAGTYDCEGGPDPDGLHGRRIAYAATRILDAWRIAACLRRGDLDGAEAARSRRWLPWSDIVPYLPPGHRDRRGYTH